MWVIWLVADGWLGRRPPSIKIPQFLAVLGGTGILPKGPWLIRWSPKVGVIWLVADGWLGRRPPGPMPQLEDGVRHGLEVSRFLDLWPYWGTGILLKGPCHVPGVPLGVEFGCLQFFLHIHKKT